MSSFVAGTIGPLCAKTQIRYSALEEATLAVPETTGDDPKINFGDWSAIRIKAYGEALGISFPKPIAIVEIPRLRLRAPLFEGIEDLTLERGLGRVPGSALPGADGNLAIAGHRDSFFRVLKDIRQGDTIRIATPEDILTYAVERTSVVRPNDVSVLKPRAKPALTLITCYPFYFNGHAPQRFIVEAVLAGRTSRLSRTIEDH